MTVLPVADLEAAAFRRTCEMSKNQHVFVKLSERLNRPIHAKRSLRRATDRATGFHTTLSGTHIEPHVEMVESKHMVGDGTTDGTLTRAVPQK